MKGGISMTLGESAEDYLESILMLQDEKHYARSVDIAAKLKVTKPSVSVAMKHLREQGYITIDDDYLIHLTEKGEAIASRIYDRHNTISSYLVHLGVDEETARNDACKMEHDISEQTYQAIKKALNEKMQQRS